MEKGISPNAVKPGLAAEVPPLVKQVHFEGREYVLRAGHWENIPGGRTIAVCLGEGCSSVGELKSLGAKHTATPYCCLDHQGLEVGEEIGENAQTGKEEIRPVVTRKRDSPF